jgi:hypothetical protein
MLSLNRPAEFLGVFFAGRMFACLDQSTRFIAFLPGFLQGYFGIFA